MIGVNVLARKLESGTEFGLEVFAALSFVKQLPNKFRSHPGYAVQIAWDHLKRRVSTGEYDPCRYGVDCL